MSPMSRSLAATMFAMAGWSSMARADCGFPSREAGSRDVGSAETKLAHPVPGRVLSRFGLRPNPVTRIVQGHTGIDYAGAIGDPVRTAAGGEVVFSGLLGNLGVSIVVRHDVLGLETLYAHLSQSSVRPGDCVVARQSIGAIGVSGMSSGPHLHFEVRAPVDPMIFLPSPSR